MVEDYWIWKNKNILNYFHHFVGFSLIRNWYSQSIFQFHRAIMKKLKIFVKKKNTLRGCFSQNPVKDLILCIHRFEKKTDYSVLTKKQTRGRKISFACAKIFNSFKKSKSHPVVLKAAARINTVFFLPGRRKLVSHQAITVKTIHPHCD